MPSRTGVAERASRPRERGAYRIAVRVLVAPDKFRGTLTAAESAAAISAGWRRARPSDEVVELPLADGGEGTLETLVGALGGTTEERTVSGPLGDPVRARYGIADATAVVELARASGLALVSEPPRPLDATTRGTGELIRDAARAGAREIVVALGGSASTDGGAGLAGAVGVHLLDAAGRPIPEGGRGLFELATIDLGGLDPAVRAASIVAATDVANPLTGPNGAARVFAPQKGASPDEAAELEIALAHLAAVIERDVGVDVRAMPGGGAAGGTAAGLVALLGARIRSGASVVLDAVAFDRALARADLVITGEGRFDATSLGGKVVGTVLAHAAAHDVPVLALCGEAEDGDLPHGLEVRSLVDAVGRERALADATRALGELAEETAASWRRLSSRP